MTELEAPKLTTTEKAIAAAGGNQIVADAIGVDPSTVWRWGQLNLFKPGHVVKLCELTKGTFTPEQIRPDIFGE